MLQWPTLETKRMQGLYFAGIFVLVFRPVMGFVW
jgi:hypothetical protein